MYNIRDRITESLPWNGSWCDFCPMDMTICFLNDEGNAFKKQVEGLNQVALS